MTSLAVLLRQVFSSDGHRDRVVPPTGYTSILTTATSGIMAFLTVFALALSFAADRLGERWSDALSDSATIRISASAQEQDAQVERVMEILTTTQGVKSARVLSDEEQRMILAPWFGTDLPIERLNIPRVIDVTLNGEDFSAKGLALRLRAEAPAAMLDDHGRWRMPLVKAANRLKVLGWVSMILIVVALVSMITLAARAALSANAQVIRVLRLIGAQDSYIATAFVRRFSVRAFVGAVVGTVFASLVLFLLPSAEDPAGILTGLRIQGVEWLWILVLPLFSMCIGFFATRRAALIVLGELT